MGHSIGESAAQAARFLLGSRPARPGELFVVGCSSSEVAGGEIGKRSSPDVGLEIAQALLGTLDAYGLHLAAQCCEHLNRALVLERVAAERHGLQIVHAVPKPGAGGSFATAVYGLLRDPVLAQDIRAQYGLDIGLTMIGMHLRPVAVPVRIRPDRVGSALVTGAYTRPPLIGGERAAYE